MGFLEVMEVPRVKHSDKVYRKHVPRATSLHIEEGARQVCQAGAGRGLLPVCPAGCLLGCPGPVCSGQGLPCATCGRAGCSPRGQQSWPLGGFGSCKTGRVLGAGFPRVDPHGRSGGACPVPRRDGRLPRQPERGAGAVSLREGRGACPALPRPRRGPCTTFSPFPQKSLTPH